MSDVRSFSFNDPEMLQCFVDTIFVHTGCHIIGSSLHFIVGVAHGDTDACMAEHADVIATIAESHGFFQCESEVLDELVDTVLLGIALGGDVNKSRMPTAELSICNKRKHFLFLFGSEEGSQLIYLSLDSLFEGVFRKFLYTEMFIEDVSEQVIGMADRGIVFAHKDTRETVLFTEIGDALHVFIRYGTFIDDLIAYIAIATVHGDITVYQSTALQFIQIVDD